MNESAVRWSVAGYEVFDLIGRGGSGAVYKAREVAFDRIVAIKVIEPDGSGGNGSLQRRFERECELAGRLTGHPNVVTPLSVGVTDDGSPFLVMELCTGGSLAEMVAAGPMPVDEVVTITRQLGAALLSAHRRGVIHCDVKPRNVVFRWTGEPALTDFGVARIAGSTGSSSTMLALTPLHAAPELLRGAAPTAASDAYSLGSTVYAMLAGAAPLSGESDTPYAVLNRVLNVEPPPLDRGDVEPELAALVHSLLAKSPGDRPRLADALDRLADVATRRRIGGSVVVMDGGDYLDEDPTDEHAAIVAEVDAPASSAGGVPSEPPGPTPTRPGRRAVLAGLTAVALVAGLVAFLAGRGSSPPRVASSAGAQTGALSSTSVASSPGTTELAPAASGSLTPFERVPTGIVPGSTNFPGAESTTPVVRAALLAAEPAVRSLAAEPAAMSFTEINDAARFPRTPISFSEGFRNVSFAPDCTAFTSPLLQINGVAARAGIAGGVVVFAMMADFASAANATEFAAGRSLELGVTDEECSGITAEAVPGPSGVTVEHRSVLVPAAAASATRVNTWRAWNWESFATAIVSTQSMVATCDHHVVQLAVGAIGSTTVSDERFDGLAAELLGRVPGGCR